MSGPAEFRKRPIVIDAMQWDGSAAGAGPIIDWILRNDGTATYHEHLMDGDLIAHPAPYLRIQTLEGDSHGHRDPRSVRVTIAKSGDWVIRGVKGEFYPCKPDIFAATYEVAS